MEARPVIRHFDVVVPRPLRWSSPSPVTSQACPPLGASASAYSRATAAASFDRAASGFAQGRATGSAGLATAAGAASWMLLRRQRRAAAERRGAWRVSRCCTAETTELPEAAVALQQAEQSAMNPRAGDDLVEAAARRRKMRRAQYEEMKRENLLDASIVGLIGAGLSFLNAGLQGGEGFAIGSAVGVAYLLLLHRDVDELGVDGRTPLDVVRPFRVARFLVPFLMVPLLAATSALEVGIDSWLDGVRWDAGSNFSGVMSPAALYASLTGYTVTTMTLWLRGFARGVKIRDAMPAMPGSLGVAAKLVNSAEKQKGRQESADTPARPVKQVPVLLVSGPRGCGKTTLVQRLRERDERFAEPTWISTEPCATKKGSSIVSEADFETLEDAGALAVSYRPYDEEGEQLSLGLPVAAVLDAAEAGACVLDVDPPTARMLLQCDWEAELDRCSPDIKLELRVVAIWVSLSSLDAIELRNQRCLEAAGMTSLDVARQLKPMRSQAAKDIEWAVTSGNFDFTVLNEDLEGAEAEVIKAARYCF
mmetsp:Transcript_46961/g.102137  ORF Transcript_46961/g.102137 Transcript_46961/m.102137 type:complete len:536 (+) Transcript_46961:57-1664(+)|eukprot:CAMPEP_0170606406 /NCGR_PEP_ID=MMETSP0224-20130122/20496_1 /TAXON_ID=285029 /ORGANISM="Togula jolla, Strain CCCM 725" /LENGTH=535 /DNA_ID=CAMNT_0010931487 /DNA_START=22 /DNA_END=1629 /DNA_ORIENTATION=-